MADVLTDFDAWARMSARLRGIHKAGQQAVVAEYGLSQIWPEADAHWRQILIEDIAAGDMERVFQYSEICSEQPSIALSSPGGEVDATQPPAAPAIPTTTPPQAATATPVQPPPAQPPAQPPPVQPPLVQPPPVQPPPVVAPAAAPTSSPPPGSGSDFRHDALYAENAGVAHGVTIPFDGRPLGEQMGMNTSSIDRPVARQAGTAPAQGGLRTTVQAAREATNWPVERYAEMRVAMERTPQSFEEVLQHFQLPNRATYDFVCRTWQQRLTTDQALMDRFSQARDRLRQGSDEHDTQRF